MMHGPWDSEDDHSHLRALAPSLVSGCMQVLGMVGWLAAKNFLAGASPVSSSIPSSKFEASLL
jgi:hypothetical protein